LCLFFSSQAFKSGLILLLSYCSEDSVVQLWYKLGYFFFVSLSSKRGSDSKAQG
jgi:hypothetical protein